VKVVRPDGTVREFEAKGKDVKVYEVMPDGSRKPVKGPLSGGKGHFVIEDKDTKLDLNIATDSTTSKGSADAGASDARIKALETRIQALENLNKALRRQLEAAGKTIPKGRGVAPNAAVPPNGIEAPDAQMGDFNQALEGALSQIGPEIEKALQAVQPEIEKALKEAQPEIEKALKDAPHGAGPDAAKQQAEMERHVRETVAEAMKAMAESMKGAGEPQ
jgi:hypothetical protein